MLKFIFLSLQLYLYNFVTVSSLILRKIPGSLHIRVSTSSTLCNVDYIFENRESETNILKVRPKRYIANTNHTGIDYRMPENDRNKTGEYDNEIHRIQDSFHKLELIDQLMSPGNPISKLDLIRRESLEIYGNTEICGVNLKKLFAGFDEFFMDELF